MFDLEQFIKFPSFQTLESCKKDELLAISIYYKIDEISPSLNKDIIKSKIVEYFTVNGFKINESFTAFVKEKSRFNVEFNAENIVNITSRTESIYDEEEKGSSRFLDVLDDLQDVNKYKIDAMVGLEREKLSAQMQEMEVKLKFELEYKKIELEHAVRLKELEILNKNKMDSANNGKCGNFDITAFMKLAPKFNELAVDQFFLHFKKVAYTLKWPEEYWSLLIQSVLSGKAQQIYNELSVEQCADYNFEKSCVLRAYELVPEAYRQEFRNLRKDSETTYIEFASVKRQYLKKWCSASGVGSDFEKLLELILMEEFKNSIDVELKQYLNEKGTTTVDDAATLAEEYALTHKEFFSKSVIGSKCVDYNNEKISRKHLDSKQTQREITNNLTFEKCNYVETRDTMSHLKPNSYVEQNILKGNILNQPKPIARTSGSTYSCFYCKDPDHFIAKCPKLQNKLQKDGISVKPVCHLQTVKPNCSKEVSGDVLDSYGPFLTEGTVSVSEKNQGMPVQILRDTGTCQSLVLEEVLPESSKLSYCGTVSLRGLECSIHNVPVHRVFLKSSLFTGIVKVGVVKKLPCAGVHFLLGNDIANGKINIPCSQVKSIGPNFKSKFSRNAAFALDCISKFLAIVVKLSCVFWILNVLLNKFYKEMEIIGMVKGIKNREIDWVVVLTAIVAVLWQYYILGKICDSYAFLVWIFFRNFSKYVFKSVQKCVVYCFGLSKQNTRRKYKRNIRKMYVSKM